MLDHATTAKARAMQECTATMQNAQGDGTAVIVRWHPEHGWQRRRVTVDWVAMTPIDRALTTLGDPLPIAGGR